MRKDCFGVFLVGIALLCAASAFSQEGAPREIVFVHGNAIGFVRPRRDIALGTQAAWHPTGRTIVFAASGEKKELVFGRLPGPGSPRPEIVSRKAVPIPVVRTRFEAEWQWSFSPDRRWLVVDRRIACKHRRPHGLSPEASAAARELRWTGVVDQRSGKARKFGFIPQDNADCRLLGWQGGNCLLRLGTRVLSVEAQDPQKVREYLKGRFTSIVAVSPDGRRIVTYDGREGDITCSLHDLQTAKGRLLLRDPLGPQRKSYAHGGGVVAAFSQDSRWVAVKRFLRDADKWNLTVRLESVDGTDVRYKDAFALKKLGTVSRIRWSPSGPERFFYFRSSGSGKEHTLIVVDAKGGKPTRKQVKVHRDRLRSYALRPLWSPRGDRIAWLTDDRHVLVYSVAKDSTEVLGKLPDDATSWSWAPARVMTGP